MKNRLLRLWLVPVLAFVAALGNAYTALAGDDVNALYWNPAGLAQVRKKELGFTHAQWLLGTQYNFAAFSLPVDGAVLGQGDYHGALALGLMGVSVDGVDSRGADRSAQAGVEAGDRAFLLGTGVNHGPSGLNAGLGFKFIESEIAGFTARTFAVDLGLQRKFSLGRAPLRAGFAARNLGPGLKFLDQRDPLPSTLSLGLGGAFNHTINLALDLNYHLGENRISVGGKTPRIAEDGAS